MTEILGLNRVGGGGGVWLASMAITFKSSSGVPQWLSMEGKRISCGDRVGLGEEGALQ